jgi:hypothetical protein
MSQLIGYQSGIRAAVNRLRDLDQKGTAVKKGADGKWLPISTLPPEMSRWGAWDKLERTLGILVSEHDAAIAPVPDPEPPPPPPPPPPPEKRLAPMTHYATPRADARYCVHSPGVTMVMGDDWVDEGGFHYTENGLCKGGRTGKFVPELKPADSMDGLEPCDGYEKDGRRFPPWPAASYEV